MTRSEQRFIEHWKEQRSGTRTSYYLIFTLAWTVVSFLVMFFLTKFFTRWWETSGELLIMVLAAVALVIGLLATHLTYTFSERKFKRITDRDARQLN